MGLTENPSALRRWMVSGPEIARIINEFEASMVTECPETEQSAKHHEDTRSLQSLFYRDVVSLTRTIEEMGNPFMEETDDLLALDTKQIMRSGALARLRKVEEVGMAQYESFIAERLMQQSKSLYDPIKRNNLRSNLRQTWHVRPSSSYHLQGMIACSFQGYTSLARRGKEIWMSFSTMKTKVVHRPCHRKKSEKVGTSRMSPVLQNSTTEDA